MWETCQEASTKSCLYSSLPYGYEQASQGQAEHVKITLTYTYVLPAVEEYSE